MLPEFFTRHGTALDDLIFARRATHMKPLFWQAPEIGANFYENPRQKSIEKRNDCVMNPEQSALVKGSDPR